jgi:hypothetical protein
VKDEWTTLRDHIRNLLRDGKRGTHPDFKLLFEVWGEPKIRDMATEILREEKEKSKNETPTD